MASLGRSEDALTKFAQWERFALIFKRGKPQKSQDKVASCLQKASRNRIGEPD